MNKCIEFTLLIWVIQTVVRLEDELDFSRAISYEYSIYVNSSTATLYVTYDEYHLLRGLLLSGIPF